MKTANIRLKKDKESVLRKGHPWVYRDAVVGFPGHLKPGEPVCVVSHIGEMLGSGIADPNSTIAVRMITGAAELPVSEKIKACLERAFLLRTGCFACEDTDGYRLFNGEGDGIPGLVIDRFADIVGIHIYSEALLPWLDLTFDAVRERLSFADTIFVREASTRVADRSPRLLSGPKLPERTVFRENGMCFEADLISGQKTGFFLDQRDNRGLVRRVSISRKVANICGYTGAFTVAAALGGAESSVTVDCASPSLQAAERNFKLNRLDLRNHQTLVADMQKFLTGLAVGEFDLIVLDPPSMAKSRKDLGSALSCYRRINTLAFKKLPPGGLLFTASCTGQLSREEFTQMISDSAFKASRQVQILHESAHAIDHPISLQHCEGRYLKGILLRVVT